MSDQETESQGKRIVSVWVCSFDSIEEAEAYFGMDLEVCLPPEGFTRDLGIEECPVDNLEAHFEQLSPRSIEELLESVTYSSSFREQAIEAASRQGIRESQGIALVYDFDYQAAPNRRDSVGPLRFLGSFPFVGNLGEEECDPIRDPTIRILPPAPWRGYEP